MMSSNQIRPSGNQVRPYKVLEIKSILLLDGSDGLTLNIKEMSKIDQLDHVLKITKRPEDGLTFTELTWIFYGSSKDVRTAQKEQNEALIKWTPSAQQDHNMRGLITNHRNRQVKYSMPLYYSFPTVMPDFNNEERNVLQLPNTIEKSQKIRRDLINESDGFITREGYIKELEDEQLHKSKSKKTKKNSNGMVGNSKKGTKEKRE